jgi:VanZ family protein
VLAILSTAVIASCDEFHQSFIPGRTGTPVDVLLDASGACTLCLIVWLMFWRGGERQEAW